MKRLTRHDWMFMVLLVTVAVWLHSARSVVKARTETDGRNVLWLMDTTDAFADTHDGAVIKEACDTTAYDVTGWRIINTGPVDFDGDGKGDILWWQSDTTKLNYGATVAWMMDGCTLRISRYIAVVSDTDWEMATFTDADGDGKTDIVWHYHED